MENTGKISTLTFGVSRSPHRPTSISAEQRLANRRMAEQRGSKITGKHDTASEFMTWLVNSGISEEDMADPKGVVERYSLFSEANSAITPFSSDTDPEALSTLLEFTKDKYPASSQLISQLENAVDAAKVRANAVNKLKR